MSVQYQGLMSRALVLLGRVTAQSLPRATGQEFSVFDANSIAASFYRGGLELLNEPRRLAEVQRAYFQSMTEHFTTLMSGSSVAPDRRFKDASWESDITSRFLRDAYLSFERSANDILQSLPASSKDAFRISFYVRQIISALSPSNFFATNPQARNLFIETDGQSLLNGLSNLLDDLERGEGRLDITTNSSQAFEVGKNLATTPGKVVFQNDMMQLIQYEPLTDKQHSRPMLFVPAWINKFYILDLTPKNSLVRYMLEQGHTIFVISWVNPGPEHADKGFENYLNEGPLAALDTVEQITGADKVNVMGFCIGGILVMAMLAYLETCKEDRIGTATTLASMIDFSEVGDIGVFIDRDRLTALREHMADKGYLEEHHLQEMFSTIREKDLIWSFHVSNYLLGKKPPAFDLLYWNADSTRLPARMLEWYIEKIYIENRLLQPNGLELNSKKIDLSKIKVPFYALAAKEDHISLWTSVFPATEIISDNVTFVLAGSGHIAGVINPPRDKPKYYYRHSGTLGEGADAWLASSEKVDGSWWPHWVNWLRQYESDAKVPARPPAKNSSGVFEDAPGQFVRRSSHAAHIRETPKL
ncbi:PHA/PHB synthase family protein [Ruegeria sp. 2012CJ15-1]